MKDILLAGAMTIITFVLLLAVTYHKAEYFCNQEQIYKVEKAAKTCKEPKDKCYKDLLIKNCTKIK